MSLNFNFYISNAFKGNIKYIKMATMKLMGTNSVGVDPNWNPYRKKFSKMLRKFKIRNMMPAKLINPLNFWVGDSPLKMEICFTRLGINARQLLYFRFLSIAYLIYEMVAFDDVTVTNLVWLTDYDFLAAGK